MHYQGSDHCPVSLALKDEWWMNRSSTTDHNKSLNGMESKKECPPTAQQDDKKTEARSQQQESNDSIGDSGIDTRNTCSSILGEKCPKCCDDAESSDLRDTKRRKY